MFFVADIIKAQNFMHVKAEVNKITSYLMQ